MQSIVFSGGRLGTTSRTDLIFHNFNLFFQYFGVILLYCAEPMSGEESMVASSDNSKGHVGTTHSPALSKVFHSFFLSFSQRQDYLRY